VKYFLTGATGFIGRHVAEELMAEGHQVRCLARKPERAASLASSGAEVVSGDLADAPLLREAVKGSDVVVHAAAQVGDWGARRRFEDANVGGTRNVLDAAETAGVERFVHVSSVAVYGRQGPKLITEAAGYHVTGDPYCDTKIAAEEAAWERHRAGRLRVTCVRPSAVYGPHDWRFVPRVVQGLRAGRIPMIEGGRHAAPIVYVRDVSRLVRACAQRPEAVGEVFNCVSTEGISWRGFFTAIARLAGLPPPSLSVPYRLAFATGAVLETLYRLVGSEKPPLVTRFNATLLGTPLTYDMSKAERVLGFRPAVTVATGLPETIAWMQAEQRQRRDGRAA
jgi:nucleoside-diphosphate-sugar epimerase